MVGVVEQDVGIEVVDINIRGFKVGYRYRGGGC